MTHPPLAGGFAPPHMTVLPPGPRASAWLERAALSLTPMGPRLSGGGDPGKAPKTVYQAALGVNVLDVDGNRYVDLAGGFGAMLLGHSHPAILRAVSRQHATLAQALGDVYSSDVKLTLAERLTRLYPGGDAKVIFGQSGADAVTAALKTAVLYGGRAGVVAFSGCYHGLSYAPLAACGLRESYREPFRTQLNPAVRFVDYPISGADAASTLRAVAHHLEGGEVGCVLIEPVLGRGGCVSPPTGFLRDLGALTQSHGALFIADEIWTGLGRSGEWLSSVAAGASPDLVCLGKGLGGGLPISACVGRTEIMQAWCREAEVVHTSTFAGAPLACAAALGTLEVLADEGLVERAAAIGPRWSAALRQALAGVAWCVVRGSGLMIGIDLGERGTAARVAARLLERGYIVSTGGGSRDVVVLTPPLNIPEELLAGFVPELRAAVEELAGAMA